MPPRLDEKSETERVVLPAPKSWTAVVDEWRWQNRIKSRAEAIRILVETNPQIADLFKQSARLLEKGRDE